ncbi:MAG: ABC transporter ATP-binding protein [Erysipelotrichaceae bacterium]|nr:ABC transporter ATP-binding protein [Erysipelotrichaceae bacterium]
MPSKKIKLYQEPHKIISYWIHQPFIVSMIVIFGLAFNILMPWGAVTLGKLMDTILISSGPTPIIQGIITYLEVILFIQALRFVKRFYIRRFANRTLASMRSHVFNSILSQPFSSFLTTDPGNFLSRIIGDVDACVEGMRKFTTELFDTGVLMTAYVVTMISFDLTIGLVSILFIPVAMLIAEKLKKVIVKASSSYRQQNAVVTSLTIEASENALLYRISGVDPVIEKAYDEALLDLQKKAINANVLENSMQPLYNAISMTGVIFVFLLGGNKVIQGEWTIGSFTAFYVIFTAMSLKSSKAAKLFNSVQKSSVSWARIKPYMKPYQELFDSKASQEKELSLEFKDLSFSYGDALLLKDINLKLESGQICGITGPIACGKSTLLSVLTGLLPYQGCILINGKELREMDPEERSSWIAYLPQRAQLFGESLVDNITWESGGDIDEVLELTQLKDEVKAMTLQKETSAGNLGSRLSGGQKARVALSRALFSQRRLLLLDDPFASVDIATEQKIIKALKETYPETIILLVSHRVAMFSQFDQVLFLEAKGKAIIGSSEELIKKSELYRNIFELQESEIDDEN